MAPCLLYLLRWSVGIVCNGHKAWERGGERENEGERGGRE